MLYAHANGLGLRLAGAATHLRNAAGSQHTLARTGNDIFASRPMQNYPRTRSWRGTAGISRAAVGSRLQNCLSSRNREYRADRRKTMNNGDPR